MLFAVHVTWHCVSILIKHFYIYARFGMKCMEVQIFILILIFIVLYISHPKCDENFFPYHCMVLYLNKCFSTFYIRKSGAQFSRSSVRSINVNSDTCYEAACLLFSFQATAATAISQTNCQRSEHKKNEIITKIRINEEENRYSTAKMPSHSEIYTNNIPTDWAKFLVGKKLSDLDCQFNCKGSYNIEIIWLHALQIVVNILTNVMRAPLCTSKKNEIVRINELFAISFWIFYFWLSIQAIFISYLQFAIQYRNFKCTNVSRMSSKSKTNI